jgi:hypothetical protein
MMIIPHYVRNLMAPICVEVMLKILGVPTTPEIEN